jgi:hypothetical protein
VKTGLNEIARGEGIVFASVEDLGKYIDGIVRQVEAVKRPLTPPR